MLVPIKNFLRRIVLFVLKIEAKLVLRRYKPKVVAVTGTVGKTSARNAITAALSNEVFVRKSEGVKHRQLDVALAIIGGFVRPQNFGQAIFAVMRGVKILITKHDYPDWLVLEFGVESPGDMSKFLSLLTPDIAVITSLGDVPAHVETFEHPEDIIEEKMKLIKSLKEGSFVILNGDDEALRSKIDKIKVNVLTYGFSEGVNFRASNYSVIYKKDGSWNIPEGVTFKTDYKGNIVPIRLFDALGRQSVYAALAGVAVASAVGLNVIESAQALSRYRAPAGRLKLLWGVKNSFIIDDTYNSSPVAATAAIEVLNELPSQRKIAVLGDMLDLGKFTIEEHKKLGMFVKNVTDLLFVVGPRAKFIAEAAIEGGFNQKKVFEFSGSDEVGTSLQDKLEEGDLVLVKGSRAMKMEKIVEEIMLEPKKKDELLVR
jgi:UDP-N-acetylmuramoyl-tripeptide--D-alanyl-D-alanine ligase